MRGVEELTAAVDGRVLVRGTEGFADAVRGHNHALVHDPEIVVVAADAADVAATIGIARRHGLSVQAQSTGHGPSRVTRGGVLLRTGALDGIDIDPERRTVRVGAGAVWGDLVAACAEQGLAPLGMASVASVGVAGYLLGGGMGPLGRRDGFAADHVLAVEVVTADGRSRTVDACHDTDLFWALRGGRMVPGVVTAFTLRLGRSPELFAATLTYDRPDAAALAGYAGWQRDLPDATTSVAALFRFPDLPTLPGHLRGRSFLAIEVIHAGEETSGRAVLDRLTAVTAPTTREAGATDPARWLRAQSPVPPGPSWQRGVLLRRFDPDAAAEVLAAAGPADHAPWRVVEIRPMGGALGRPPAVANAVGGRSDGVVLSVVAPSTDDSGDLPAAHARLVERMRPWVVPGLHVNFRGPEDAHHPLRGAWPVETWGRLADIRAAHDPTCLFPAPAASR